MTIERHNHMNAVMEKTGNNIGIIGGGIMGVTLAYRLSQKGFKITIYEQSNSVGGLVRHFDYEGAHIDRFYHTILSSDLSMQNLIKETGIEDKLHFTETKQAFYDNGKLYPFNTPVELMTYPPLRFFERFRLGLQILYSQLESDWHEMDKIPVQDWLIKVSGKAVYEKVWKPLLRAKFDTMTGSVPATYIWSRLRRMLKTREGVTSREMMCYLETGYSTLVDAMAEVCYQHGVEIELNTGIEKILTDEGHVTGIVKKGGQIASHDILISTLPSPILASILPEGYETFYELLNQQQYLGVLCPLLILKQKLTPYYVLNITDESIPFTAVVETTNLIDPKYVNNYHLVYLPKYIEPNSPLATLPDDEIKTMWMANFKKMFPDFDESLIQDFIVQRARYVEPIRPINTSDQIPDIQTPIDGLYMGNTVMIYPDLGNGEAVTSFADKMVAQILETHKSIVV
ncbi:FAD-dependent oxidoreductase [bacterium]|nr:FAD-dependent oxidoreductase [bacterium]